MLDPIIFVEAKEEQQILKSSVSDVEREHFKNSNALKMLEER